MRMTSFELLLVRHGLTDWNEDGRLLGRIDVELNERGRRQAERVARALESFALDAVVSSPQPRTLQTAEPIASSHELEVRVVPELDEVWLSASWQGKTVAELRGDVELERLIDDPTHRTDVIEPIEDVRARSVKGVEELRERYPDGRVVVVSHGDPLRTIVLHYLGVDLGALRRISIDNGSVSIVRFGGLGPRLALLNWTPSLPRD